jgi:DNA-binding NarL/FixJ family response regulator
MLERVGDNASGVGYLLKDRVGDVAEFIDAVARVAAGGTAVDPGVLNGLVVGRRRFGARRGQPAGRTVLSLIAEGRSNRAIAQQPFLRPPAIQLLVRHASVFTTEAQTPAWDEAPTCGVADSQGPHGEPKRA